MVSNDSAEGSLLNSRYLALLPTNGTAALLRQPCKFAQRSTRGDLAALLSKERLGITTDTNLQVLD